MGLCTGGAVAIRITPYVVVNLSHGVEGARGVAVFLHAPPVTGGQADSSEYVNMCGDNLPRSPAHAGAVHQ